MDGIEAGLAFIGSIQTAPSTSLVPGGGPKKGPAQQYEGGLEFILPIDEVYLRAIFSSRHFGTYAGRAADSLGTYDQSASGDIRLIGGKVSINTFVSRDGNRRAYFGGGLGQATVRTRLNRTYASQAFQADAKGRGLEWSLHVGFGTMLVQNWQFFVEGGYRGLNVGNFTFTGNENLRGEAHAAGDATVYTDSRAKAGFKVSAFHLLAGLMLGF